MEEKKKVDKIKIKAIQAANLYEVNNPLEDKKESKLYTRRAFINKSLFSEYMLKHGVTINKYGNSRDFIVLKFDYGVKGIITAEKLREEYYKNGVTVTWETFDKNGKVTKSEPIHYKRLMRSTGAAKEGHCIFIRNELHKKAKDFITMNLYDKMPEHNAKIVELSAYETLITATALDYINIPIKNIFVVQDEEIKGSKQAVTVKVGEVQRKKINHVTDYDALEDDVNKLGFTFYKTKQKEYPELVYIKKTHKDMEDNGIIIDGYPQKEVERICTEKSCFVERLDKPVEVTNVLWDGMGLIDDSIFPESMDGFIYCRSHFFKSCLFRGNIQQYFKDYYGEKYDTTVLKDMFGRKIRVADIKVIVTNNSLKWLKFTDIMGKNPFGYWKRHMHNYGDKFAIVKTGHASKYGKLQRSSYQMNNSLPTTDREILERIAQSSIDYCDALKLDDNAFMEHLKATASGAYKINNVLLAIQEKNEYFKDTKYFRDQRKDIISRFKTEKLQLGKLLQLGDNLTICGNPVALLMKVTEQNFLDEPCFKPAENGIQCYVPRFSAGENLAGFRSPHNSPNNIVHLVNVYPEELVKYFPKLGNNVIVVNGIRTDVQQRLNGMDYDTDCAYVTNQVDIVSLAEQAYQKYPTIINGVKMTGSSEYSNDMASYADMDNDIAATQEDIGYASNLAQLALSYYYDGEDKDHELEDVFVICSVLAQCAIDSAKRKFEINVSSELNKINSWQCMQRTPQYPQFFYDILKQKERNQLQKKEIKPEDVGTFDCPMDILYEIIKDGVIDKRKMKHFYTSPYAIKEIFEFNAYKYEKKKNSKQYNRILETVKKYDEELKKLTRGNEDYKQQAQELFDECIKSIKNVKIQERNMCLLMAYAFDFLNKNTKKDSNLCDNLLAILYEKDKDMFMKFVKNVKKVPQKGEKPL